jgi:hypothetical protein
MVEYAAATDLESLKIIGCLVFMGQVDVFNCQRYGCVETGMDIKSKAGIGIV